MPSRRQLQHRVRRYERELGGGSARLSADELREWIRQLGGGLSQPSEWRRMRDAPPPLRAESPPSTSAQLTVWFWSWGWVVVAAAVGAAGGCYLFADDISKWWQQKGRAPRQGHARGSSQSSAQSGARQAEGTPRRSSASAEEPESPRARPEPTRSPGSSNGASGSADGVPVLSAASFDTVLERGQYVVICVTNAGIADRSTMHGVAAHLEGVLGSSDDFRQWTVALLDYHAEAASAAQRPARLTSILSHVRHAPVAVLRKGRKLACFSGRPSPRQVEDWLTSLRMGEVTWLSVEED